MLGVYESEISTLLDGLRDRVSAAEEAGGSAGPLAETEQEFSKVQQALKQLEVEARTSADSASRKALQAKVAQFKEDCRVLRRRFEATKGSEERRRLLNSENGGSAGVSSEDRQRLNAVSDRMREGTSSLENSKRTMLEIEETAAGVTEQLAQNRSTIESTRRKVDETSSLSRDARGLLRKFERNEQVKRLCGYGAVVLVVFCLLVLVYSILIGF